MAAEPQAATTGCRGTGAGRRLASRSCEDQIVFDEWKTDENGKAVVYPLVAYETFVPHGVLCGLRVHYLEGPDELVAGAASSVPLVMTVEMARALAAALAKVADEAEHGPTGEAPH